MRSGPEDYNQLPDGAISVHAVGTPGVARTAEVTLPALAAFIVFWGVGLGGSIPVRFAMLADYFGRRNFGTIMGVMTTCSTIFGAAGPVFVGWMFDVRGNYRDPFLIMAGTILISIPLILTLPRPNPVRSR